LNEWGGYSLAFFLAVGAVGLAVLIMLPASEQRRPRQRPSVGGIGHLMTRRDVLLPSILSAVILYVDFATTFGFNPILAKQLGGTDVTQSMLVSMHLGVIILGNLMATTIANRIGFRWLVFLGFGVLCLGIGLASLAPSLAVLFVAQFCLGLAFGLNYPVLMGLSIQYVGEAERTTAMGLHQSVYSIGMFAGPWLSGILADAIGLRPMFGVTAFTCLVVSFFLTAQLVTSNPSFAPTK
jgi:MFS family permease